MDRNADEMMIDEDYSLCYDKGGGDALKDMPVFTTENGVASLTLKEIPYSGKAYIRLQSALQPKELLEECSAFCRAVGASEIYATGDAILCTYPVHTEIVQMSGKVNVYTEPDIEVQSLSKSELIFFREIYNEKMANVHNSAYMSQYDANKILESGQGYVIAKAGKCIGIGIVGDGMIKMIATVVPHTGDIILHALSKLMPEREIKLEVATENKRAMTLYSRVGLRITEHIATWYKIL